MAGRVPDKCRTPLLPSQVPAACSAAGETRGGVRQNPPLGIAAGVSCPWGSGVVWFLDQLTQGGRMDGWICGLPTCIGGVSNREAVFLPALV